MTSEEQFGRLRELLMDAPGIWLWEALIDELEEWEEPDLQRAAIDYVEGHLDAWDETILEASFRSWWPTFPHGTPSPFWQLARSCHFPPKPFPTRFADIFHAPFMERITHLGLSYLELKREHIEVLCELPHTHKIKALHLNNNELPKGTVQTLLTGNWGSLESLSIGNNPMGQEDIDELVQSDLIGQLTCLRITTSELDSLQAFADANLSSLRSLHLGNNMLEDDALAPLLGNPTLQQLEILSMENNRLTLHALDMLYQEKPIHTLKELYLSNVPLQQARIERRGWFDKHPLPKGLYVDIFSDLAEP